MADKITKTLNTRISLKYDLYSNWSTNNPVLLKGEIAVAFIPADSTLNEGGAIVAGTTPPNVMLKVGDGVHHYNDLKFLSSLAADVAAWAKATDKPEYTATEIKGLADFINAEIQDTDTQYTIVKVTDYQYKLMSKTLEEENFTTEVGVINIPKYDDTTVKQGIADNAAAIAVLNGEVTTIGSVKKSIADAITALNLAGTYAPLVHTHTKSEITDFEHGHKIADVEGLAEALANTDASGAADSALADAKAYADAKDAETLATAKTYAEEKAQTVQDNLTAFEAKVGTIPEDKTLVESIAEVYATKTYAEEKAQAVQDNLDAFEAKVGTISEDKTLVEDIADTYATKAFVGELPEGTTAETVIAYIDAKTADIASGTDFGVMGDRVEALETRAGEIEATHAADKAELQGNIDAVAGDLASEVSRATGRENEIENALNTYKTSNDARVKAVEDEVDVLQVQIGGLTGAMHFVGVVETDPAELTSGYAAGDVILFGSKEYVFEVTDAEAGTGVFHELGDEGSHITKTEVATTYETKADSSAKAAAAEAALAAETARALAAEAVNADAIAALATSSAADATAKADKALEDAKAYADGKDAETLAAAKTYAEEQASAAQTAAATDATTKANKALDDAKKYADEKDAETLAAAKKYADEKDAETLASAKTYAEEKATAAQTAAAADATSKANAAEAAAKEHATGLNTAMDARVAAVEAKPAMGITADNIKDYNEAVALADTAVQTVTAAADSGLTATRTGNDIQIAINPDVVFVFDCGNSVI